MLELNPIPTRGFAGTNPIVYTAPDALFHSEQGRLIIELNDRILPKLSINAEYSALLNDSCDSEVQHYVREKVAEAQALIIRALTKNEDSASPLSDEELRIELSQIGITVSRRTIAKYRTAMGIPSSSQRRAR